MLEVQLTDQRGIMATGTGRNGLDLEKFRSSISRKRATVSLLLNINRKSSRLPMVCHICQYCLVTGKDRNSFPN